MSLSEELQEHIAACFTGLWIETAEREDALLEISLLCRQHDWNLAVWDVEQGFQCAGESHSESQAGTADPLAAIRTLNALATPTGSALLVLPDFHRFLNSAEIVQALRRQIVQGKQNRTFVIILSPVVQIPVELETLFLVLHHERPNREQLAEIAQGIATEAGELPEGEALDRVLDAAAGLTRYEAEGAFSLSLVREGAIGPEAIWQLKSQTFQKAGLLQLYRGRETFSDLGGLETLKNFCLRAMRQQGNPDPLKRPKGVMLLSPPGCGKSSFAKSLGHETGRPTIILDVGRLYGGIVGETEKNVRQAFQMIDAMQPAVVMLDEVEKALSGVGGSGRSDSGVSSRLFGNFLTWLNDHESDTFVICTCNDISSLPAEFSRAGRFDGLFFIDLPNAEERNAIWAICLRTFSLDPAQPKPKDDLFTGAEIHACCRLAALLDVPLVEAATNVVPIAKTAAESIEKLRQWASGRCLSASQPGLYEYQSGSPKKRRQIPRDPSAN